MITSASRHRNAVCLAAHIVSESPRSDPAVLARNATDLWIPQMWASVAAEAGLPAPDTATQALTVAILAGAPASDGALRLSSSAAATCEMALRHQQGALLARTTPIADQQAAQIRDALDELGAPAQLRTVRPSEAA